MYKLSNGSVKLRNRQVAIWWSGEHAQHIAENFINDPQSHPVLHIRIQQLAAKGQAVKLKGVWNILNQQPEGTYQIPLLIKGKFAIIKTCIIFDMTADTLKKHKGITGTGKNREIKIPVFRSEKALEEAAFHMNCTPDEIIEELTRAINRPKKKARK